MFPLSATDQMGQHWVLDKKPQCIISLVPSQTELLFDLGLGDNIVGITRYCTHPIEALKTKQVIGGTKQFNLQVIDDLKPDLIIGNKEENYPDGIRQLMLKYPVWMSDIVTIQDALQMIREVSRITGTSDIGESIANQIEEQFVSLKPINKPLRFAYLIWRKPYMVAASGTFINHLLTLAGFTNLFEHLHRYPELSANELAAAKPDVVFLSSEPYSFSERHFDEFRAMCGNAAVMLVDGEKLSWYGSRLLLTADYLSSVISELNRLPTLPK